jgi:16S rRNA (guanine1207-N2)-methyltransferase
MAAEEFVDDPGVLTDEPLCEFQGSAAVRRRGGHAVLPWRHAALLAERDGVPFVASSESLAEASMSQCLVHLQKSRPGTWHDLAEAWRLLEPAGRLLLAGDNGLGIVSAVKRLGRELDQKPRVLSNRRHARIVLFTKDTGQGPERPAHRGVALRLPMNGEASLHASPGVFSAKRLDPGSALLLAQLGAQKPPAQIIDLGCGIGPLALYALCLWPEARALGLDGDARAIESARLNAATLGLTDRCTLAWWDAAEPCPESGFDLVLLNPPFHTGKAVDLRPARDMFERVGECLAPRGTALVVANRTLPYEQDLRRLGSLREIQSDAGFKLLALKRRATGR